MRKGKRKKGNKKLVLLMVLVLLVGIGFAALQSNLRINGNATIESVFSIGIIKIEKAESTGSAYEKTAPTFTPTTASFDVGLMAPGDSVTYDITLRNDGNLNAKLDSLVLDQNGNTNIKYEVSGIEEGFVAIPWTDKVFQVKVSYLNTENVNEMAYKEATLTMLFVQTSENTAEQDETISTFENAKPNWYSSNKFQYFPADSTGVMISNMAGADNIGDGGADIYNASDDSLVLKAYDGMDFKINYNQQYSLYAIMSSIINGKKVYTQKSDTVNFYLVLDEMGFVRNYKTKNSTTYDVIAYSKDATNNMITLIPDANVVDYSTALFQQNQYLETIVIPYGFDVSKLTNNFFYSTTGKLSHIVNQTGQTINWGPLFGESVGDCTFETGACVAYDRQITITN